MTDLGLSHAFSIPFEKEEKEKVVADGSLMWSVDSCVSSRQHLEQLLTIDHQIMLTINGYNSNLPNPLSYFPFKKDRKIGRGFHGKESSPLEVSLFHTPTMA